MNMPQIFKTKCIGNFRNTEVEKKFRFGAVKMAKSIKIEKPEELVAGYQEAECLWNVLPPSYKDRNLRQMALTNLSKMFDISGKIFWKQPQKEVVKNGVLKI